MELALIRYQSGLKHLLVNAAPGAGKTIMTAGLVRKLFKENLIDYVYVFAPSRSVCDGFAEDIAKIAGISFEPNLLLSKGRCQTFSSMRSIELNQWEELKQARVMVVLDEVHHLAGNDESRANACGKKVLEYIRDSATFTLSLSGTPWRTDKSEITLSQYDSDGYAIPNYTYSIKNAIANEICRMPEFIAFDAKVTVIQDGQSDSAKGATS
ncbi:DEAD/DEAH box helicase [Fluctibacter halophilus]|nr:DEAD/DEAH box helicase family protein [Aestuariibacter halophilus]